MKRRTPLSVTPEQGWSLLCNGVVTFDDTGELLPDGAFIAPHRPTDIAAFYCPAGVAPGHHVLNALSAVLSTTS